MSGGQLTRSWARAPTSQVGRQDGRIALVASWAVMVVILFQAIASFLTQAGMGSAYRWSGGAFTLAAAGLFLLVQHRSRRGDVTPSWSLGLLFVVCAVSFPLGGWGTPSFFWAATALARPARLAWVANGLVAVAMVAYVLSRDDVYFLFAFFFPLTDAALALLLYAMTQFAVAVGELSRAHVTMARLKVDEERLRISRDLHDIMGRSLVAVSLRVQTALITLDSDPQKCRSQLDEIAKMVADGQSSLRALTRGGTFIGLTQELESATELLARLHIRCEIDSSGDVNPTVDRLGARIVRESVTNLLKHARPTSVKIHLRTESTGSILSIVNDGVRRAPAPKMVSGTGLADLASHVVEAGGTLEADHLPDGGFRVLARLPHADGSAHPEETMR